MVIIQICALNSKGDERYWLFTDWELAYGFGVHHRAEEPECDWYATLYNTDVEYVNGIMMPIHLEDLEHLKKFFEK